MSNSSCIEVLDKIKDRIPAADYETLKKECNEESNSPAPPFFANIEKDKLLELGAIGLGGAAIAVGGAAVVGISAIALLMANQPSTVSTSYNRDGSGNVTGQVTTVT